MFDESAERAVIAAAVFDDSAVVDIASVITPGDFYISAHRAIWQRVVQLHAAGTPIDAVTLGDAVRDDGHTVLACGWKQRLIVSGDHLTRRCDQWLVRRELEQGWCPEVA